MTSGFSGENIPVIRNEMLKTNARDHIEYLDKVQKEVEEKRSYACGSWDLQAATYGDFYHCRKCQSYLGSAGK